MRAPRFLYGFLACAVLAAAVGAGCSSLPPLGARTPSIALTDTGGTRLGTAIDQLTAAHPGRSGYYPLQDGRDAFAARALLARTAERSLDVQYYIWNNDITGGLLFNALRAAADRGVRVRMLLDDNHTGAIDPILLGLDAHPNIEVRVFNPFAIRKPRVLGLLTDFPRLNRRMHNKSFTADNQVSIVGGRNIGDEYFGAGDDLLFVDLDMMSIGPVVQAISGQFDRYWNSESAYPLSQLVPHFSQDHGALPGRLLESPEALAYLDAIRRSPFVDQLMRRELPVEWATTRFVSDPPEKALGRAHAADTVAPQLRALFGDPKRELDLVSPYFIPGEAAETTFGAIARKGVKVQILTNSLEATDLPVMHSGYVKRREELLRAGVSLYEMRGAARHERPKAAGPLGSSSNALHAKTFAVDGERIFVGSFNLDQRSVALNTELGLVIESRALAERLHATMREKMPYLAYEVKLGPDGNLYWLERRDDGKVVRYDTEPGSSAWRRTSVRVLSWLPIDWLL
jgi:putative cardiolipin synthase